MRSIEKLVRKLDIPELSAEAWTLEMKKVEWRFMLEYGIPPSKIPKSIELGTAPPLLSDDWVRLMIVRPFIPGL